jgi:thioredoxin 1
MGKPIHVDSQNFDQEVLQAKETVLTDFYADWCGPCKALAPIIDEVTHELAGRLKVTKLDVDQEPQLSMKYGVQSIPTLILFQNGQEVERLIGFMPKQQLLNKIKAHLNGG